MKNDQGLDLSGLEKFEEDSSPSGEVYEKSLSVVKEAMKSVIQEVLIKLPDGSAHIVYITGLKFSETEKGALDIEFNTPSEDRKDELYAHVENCVKIQFEEYFSKNKKSWLKQRLSW